MFESIRQLVRRKKWEPWVITCRCKAPMNPSGGNWNSTMYRCFICGRLAVVYGKREPGFGPGTVSYYVPEHWHQTVLEELEEIYADEGTQDAVSSSQVQNYPYDIETHAPV